MTRTSKFWSAISCMIGLSLLACQPVIAQQSNERQLGPIFDSLSDTKAMPVVPKIVIEQEESEFETMPIGLPEETYVFEGKSDSSRNDCEGFWTAMPMPQEDSNDSSESCPEFDCQKGKCYPARQGLEAQYTSLFEAHVANAFLDDMATSETDAKPYQHSEEIADLLASGLADPNIEPESRRTILSATMKLMVRNAELEVLNLQQEREVAQLRGEMTRLQTYANQMEEVKNLLGPLYTAQNTKAQEQFKSLLTNLQLIDRTLRLLEKKEQNQQLQLTQPRQEPLPSLAPHRKTNPYVRPERWSRLPNYEQPQPRETRPNHSTMNENETNPRTNPQIDPQIFRASAPLQPAPQRLNPNEVQQERLQSEIKRLQIQLNHLKGEAQVEQAGWDTSATFLPSTQSLPNTQALPGNPLKPAPQMLRPAWPYPTR